MADEEYADYDKVVKRENGHTYIYAFGVWKTQQEWTCVEGVVTKTTIQNRLKSMKNKKGKFHTTEEVLKTPSNQDHSNRTVEKHVYDGKKRSAKEISKLTGVPESTYRRRMEKGWSVKKSAETESLNNSRWGSKNNVE